MTPFRPIVYFAEEDPERREDLSRWLQSGDFEVAAHRDGEELSRALQRARESEDHPAIILLGGSVRGLVAVTEQVRAWGWTLPIVILSDDACDAVMQAGASAVLTPPASGHDLTRALSWFLPRTRGETSQPHDDS